MRQAPPWTWWDVVEASGSQPLPPAPAREHQPASMHCTQADEGRACDEWEEHVGTCQEADFLPSGEVFKAVKREHAEENQAAISPLEMTERTSFWLF